MTDNNQTNFEDLQKLARFCNETLAIFDNLYDQLKKIITAKKQAAEKATVNVEFNQAQNAVASVANLEEINAKLAMAMGEVSPLLQQTQLLLTQSASVNLSLDKNLKDGDQGD